MSIDGPYGTPPAVGQHDHVVFVAGGIGITPCASLLTDYHARTAAGASTLHSLPPCHLQRVGALPPALKLTRSTQLIWSIKHRAISALMCSSPGCARSDMRQGDLLDHLFAPLDFDCPEHFTAMVYVTREKPTAESELDCIGNVRPVPEPTCKYGRPNFAELLSPENFAGPRVLVFACGPAAMVDDVSELAMLHGYDFHAEAFEL